jgi:hypothetical protein
VETAVSARRAGPVGEEATRLLEALRQATADWGHPDPADAPHGCGSTCRVCPVCQLVAAVQQVRPETVQQLAEAAASMAAAVSDLIAGAARPAGARGPAGDPADGENGQDRPEPTRPGPDDVQHIDITD